MAETRSSSFSLSSSNTDWWNSSRGVPCRSRKGSADCREGSRTPFSVCQHKHGTGGGQGATARAAEAMLALKETKKGKRKKKKAKKATHKTKHRHPLLGSCRPLPTPSPAPRGAPAEARRRPGVSMATPPHLELLDGLERLGAVGQRLLQVLAVGHPQLLQPRVHGGPAAPPGPLPPRPRRGPPRCPVPQRSAVPPPFPSRGTRGAAPKVPGRLRPKAAFLPRWKW